MPIYEFKCDNCQQVMEIMMKMSEPYPTSCPECKKGPIKKLISPTAFHLKGGGWFKDSYCHGPKSTNSETTCSGKSGDQTSATTKPAACENCPAAN